jgi:peptidoglycan/LPS O-acetylase OafA/YrhL
MSKTTSASSTFVLLDGLRGLGALLVLVSHTAGAWGLTTPESGAIVVDSFFLLSGFVLAFAYEPRFKSGMPGGEFMVHRLLRLFPLYLLGTVLTYVVLVGFTFGDADGGDRILAYTLQLIPQLGMLPAPDAFGSPDFYSLNTPAYTLFCELVINLVYVMAFRWLSTRVLIGVVVVSAVVLICTILHFGTISVGSLWSDWWGGLARASFAFFAGVLAFRVVGSPAVVERPRHWAAIPLLLLLPVICYIPSTPELRPFVDIGMAVLLMFPLLLVCQSIRPGDRVGRLFMFGGKISYAVYILQQPLREVLDRVDYHTTLLADIAPIGGIVAMAIVAVASYFAEKYYDRPVRRAVVRMIKLRAARRASATSFAE